MKIVAGNCEVAKKKSGRCRAEMHCLSNHYSAQPSRGEFNLFRPPRPENLNFVFVG